MRKKITTALVCAIAFAFMGMPAMADDDDDKEPKYTIKQVMKGAFKGRPALVKKVGGGDASEEEAKKLYEMLVALSKNTPKKGEKDNWKKLTGALVKASKGVVDGDADAGKMLLKAANCKTCHDSHK
ncbi:MAG: hypothetical protein AAFU85_26120 [Planctomycetota bacterium]